MKAHRTPPKPPWFSTVPRGICRWCGQPIQNEAGEKRIYWHPECVKDYWGIMDPASARRRTWKAAEGVCRGCGASVPFDECHHDHIIPLVEALPHADDRYWQWRPGNLQLLCQDCHKAKTAEEATKRARWRQRYIESQSGIIGLPGLE